MSSPRYLEALAELEPPKITVNYELLDEAWQHVIADPNDMLGFYNLAEIAFGLLAQDVQNYRIEKDISGAWQHVIEDARALHIAKNAGYAADSDDPWINFRQCEEFGVPAHTGVLVRMSDKYIRITNLLRNPLNDQVNESILDTLADLAAYALIYICIWEEGAND